MLYRVVPRASPPTFVLSTRLQRSPLRQTACSAFSRKPFSKMVDSGVQTALILIFSIIGGTVVLMACFNCYEHWDELKFRRKQKEQKSRRELEDRRKRQAGIPRFVSGHAPTAGQTHVCCAHHCCASYVQSKSGPWSNGTAAAAAPHVAISMVPSPAPDAFANFQQQKVTPSSSMSAQGEYGSLLVVTSSMLTTVSAAQDAKADGGKAQQKADLTEGEDTAPPYSSVATVGADEQKGRAPSYKSDDSG